MSIITIIMGSDIYTWVIIPLLIFLARVLDVSIGTIRLIYISKGFKYLAPIIGFFEVVIWLAAMRQIMSNLSNPVYFLAYPFGFASGTFVGMVLEEKLSIGRVGVRIISKNESSMLLKALKESKYTVTCTNATGSNGKVKVIFTVIKRQHLPHILSIIKEHNPYAYYSIEDVRYAHDESIGKIIEKRKTGLFWK